MKPIKAAEIPYFAFHDLPCLCFVFLVLLCVQMQIGFNEHLLCRHFSPPKQTDLCIQEVRQLFSISRVIFLSLCFHLKLHPIKKAPVYKL